MGFNWLRALNAFYSNAFLEKVNILVFLQPWKIVVYEKTVKTKIRDMQMVLNINCLAKQSWSTSKEAEYWVLTYKFTPCELTRVNEWINSLTRKYWMNEYKSEAEECE